MLPLLIPSKTRLKLLLRFLLNPDSGAYLRGLAQEFDENTNAVRLELNRFEEAGLITPEKIGNKKVYKVNANFPMFRELQSIAYKHFGIDQIIEQVAEKLGGVKAVYVTGDLARGLDSPVVDIVLIGEHIDSVYLLRLVEKAEKLISRKIRTLVYSTYEKIELGNPKLLIYGDEES